MSIYSFGIDSPLKLELSEEQAAAYNRVTRAFLDAQVESGSTGDPETLLIRASKTDVDAFNAVAPLLNEAIRNFGRPILKDDIHDDFLVKN